MTCHFERYVGPRFTYHSLAHTLRVVNMTEKMAKAEGRNEQDIQDLIIAAWFHDTGHSINFFGHEYYSARIADEALENLNFSAENIEKIRYLILATNPHIDPSSEDERLIKDADLHYLSGHRYFELSGELRKEWSVVEGKHFTDIEWHVHTLDFFKRHQWLSPWAKENLQHGKIQNQSRIEEKIHKLK